MRRMLMTTVTMAIGLALAVPASADPPEESGVVSRESYDDTFGIIADTRHGYWVFNNVTRDDFCAWFADPVGAPPPSNQDTDDFLVVDTGSALVTLLDGGGPSALHAFTAGGADTDPCTGSHPDPTFTGDLWVREVDNDEFNESQHGRIHNGRASGDLLDTNGSNYRYTIRFHSTVTPGAGQPVVSNVAFTLAPRPN